MNQDVLLDFYRSFQFIISPQDVHNFTSNTDLSHTVATKEHIVAGAIVQHVPKIYSTFDLNFRGRQVMFHVERPLECQKIIAQVTMAEVFSRIRLDFPYF